MEDKREGRLSRTGVSAFLSVCLVAGVSAMVRDADADELDTLLGGAPPEDARGRDESGKSGGEGDEERGSGSTEDASSDEATARSTGPPRRVGSQQVVEEIVVTARKTQENLQDVPVAVTALSGEALERSLTLQMDDLQFRIPNMSSRQAPGQSTALNVQIRGQVQTDPLGTLDQSVGFYDDGIYVARPHGANASFIDVENVQVLRGPQGTLFGRNTTGGAILLETNDPSFEGVSGAVGGTVGSFGRRALSAVLNAPILQDALAVRMVGQTLSTDGFGFDVTNQRDVGTEKHDLVRGKLLWKPRSELSFLLKGQHIQIDQLGVPVQPLFALKAEEAADPTVCCLTSRNARLAGVDYDSFVGGDPDRVHYDEGLEPVNEITVRSVDLTATWDSPWATVKFIGGLRENADAENRIDLDGTPSIGLDTNQANENFQQTYELQLTGSWLENRLNWATGVYYFDEEGEERGTTLAFVPLASVINPLVTFGDIHNDSVAGYVQATYNLTPRFRVTGGVRHTRDGKELVLHATQGDMCSIPESMRDEGAECQGTFADDFSNTSFIASADYRLFENTGFFDDVLVYGSVTTGYRSGGQNIRGTSEETLQPFDEENLMQFEGGFKSELLGRRIRLNGAGYHTLYDDIQRSIIIASDSALPATVISNAASAEITGAEIELAALTPLDGLEVGSFVGVTLPKYNEFRDVTGDRTNEPFEDVPKTSYSLFGSYDGTVFDVPWSSRIDWSWKDDIPYGPGNVRIFREQQGVDIEDLVTVPAGGILSARTGLAFGNGLEMGFFGRNLTDNRRFSALALSGGPDLAMKFVYNPGRQWGFDVKYHF